MPATETRGQEAGESPLKVLITGFGPPANSKENASWLAVKLLHNTTLYYDTPSVRKMDSGQSTVADAAETKCVVHLSTLRIPSSYESVLAIVPGLHQRPPVLPEPDDPLLALPAPPKQGFDLVLHVGAVGRGPLRIEKSAHKLNYTMMDKDGALVPLAYLSPAYMVGPMEAERLERQRLAAETQALSGAVAKPVSEIPGPTIRGFGEDYRDFPEEMQTDIDVEKLISYIKGTGSENVFASCYSSLDAGHYLSDYLYYCSLAEAKRTTTKKGKSSKVLLVQCPPVNLPLSSEEVAEALRRIVCRVCGTIE